MREHGMMSRVSEEVSTVGRMVRVVLRVGEAVVGLLAVVTGGVGGQLEAGHVARLHERIH